MRSQSDFAPRMEAENCCCSEWAVTLETTNAPFRLSHLSTAPILIGKVVNVKAPYACFMEPRAARCTPGICHFSLGNTALTSHPSISVAYNQSSFLGCISYWLWVGMQLLLFPNIFFLLESSLRKRPPFGKMKKGHG